MLYKNQNFIFSWKVNEWLEKDKGTNIKELKSASQPMLKSGNNAAEKKPVPNKSEQPKAKMEKSRFKRLKTGNILIKR